MLKSFYVALNSTAGRVGFAPLNDIVDDLCWLRDRNRQTRTASLRDVAIRAKCTTKRRICAESQTAMHTTS